MTNANDRQITYVGPETGLGSSELKSLNTILVQEKHDFDNRVGQIKREEAYRIETGFFKPSGPISNVRDVRVHIKDRTYTTLHFVLDTASFAEQTGDIILGTLDEMGMNINGLGYALVNSSPLLFLNGRFGFVSRASGIIEFIYKADNDTDSKYSCVVSYWNEVVKRESK